jgi:drug/metabolite transporter (DMT)-like permease
MTNMLSLAAFSLLLASGQVLFKQVGLSVRGEQSAAGFLSILFHPLLYAALLLYGVATILWIWILSRVPLSQASPWVGATVVVVVLLGWWLFGERPSRIFWLGLALVTIGVVLTQYGSQRS